MKRKKSSEQGEEKAGGQRLKRGRKKFTNNTLMDSLTAGQDELKDAEHALRNFTDY